MSVLPIRRYEELPASSVIVLPHHHLTVRASVLCWKAIFLFRIHLGLSVGWIDGLILDARLTDRYYVEKETTNLTDIRTLAFIQGTQTTTA